MKTRRGLNNPMRRDPELTPLWVMVPKKLMEKLDASAACFEGPPREKSRRAEVVRILEAALR